MQCDQRLKWLIVAMICPLIAGAPSSKSRSYGPCRKENLNSPECKKVTCPNPRVLENGEVTPYKSRYYVNDTTTYSCHSDYTFRGSAVRVCKFNGKWSGSTPICGRDSDYCPDPGVPPGSSRTGHMFNIDDKVKYRCDSSLTLIGSKERVCQDGGQWSGTEPQCYARFTYDTPEEASEAFSSALKSNLEVNEDEDQYGKKINLDQGGNLDIYIAVDASGSISEEQFDQAKKIIKKLIEKISYYDVSPNYEILIFATDVTKIISMREFKSKRNITYVFEQLDNFNFENQTGTNIAKLYFTILESMIIEKKNETNFTDIQHIIIVFTDGHANMGGSPKPKVDQIKHFITKNDPNREKNLDLYVFGIGDVKKEDMNGLVSQKPHETHFFVLPGLNEVEEMFDNMIDEGTSVRLCGIHQNYYRDNKRRAYPWLAQIYVARPHSSNCMGSLVTSSYILTAAHCFKKGDRVDKITVTLDTDQVVKVKNYTLHPGYNITAKKHMGINENYEFDVALIQLEEAVKMNVTRRPICIPCTKETNAALRLSDSEGTCKKHEEILMRNELVEAAFTSKMENQFNGPREIRNITIKRGKLRDICVEDARKAQNVSEKYAKHLVTDNFLCSGGTEPNTDNVACKGDSGGATYVNEKGRLIQVGIVSWGIQDICTDNKQNSDTKENTRDFHINLFSQKVLEFLKEHIENDQIGNPLTFLD